MPLVREQKPARVQRPAPPKAAAPKVELDDPVPLVRGDWRALLGRGGASGPPEAPAAPVELEPSLPAPASVLGRPVAPSDSASERAADVAGRAPFAATERAPRIHTDANADRLAAAFGAQALTFGPDVYFSPGVRTSPRRSR